MLMTERKNMKFVLLLLLFCSTHFFAQSPISLSGYVLSQDSNEPLAGATIKLQAADRATSSDEDGSFVLENLPSGSFKLSVRYLGYSDFHADITLINDQQLKITARLVPTVLKGREVVTVQTRARRGESPVPFSKLDRATIEQSYYAQDLPVLLSDLPSSTFYSESGNGLGYNYLSIRGFDQRRISVMINGVPQNDPEDHNIYWVNFPDLLENVEDIQVQRGAGSAFFGPPAIGGSINIVTSAFSAEPELSATAGYGTLNTAKYTLGLNSGLVAGKYVLAARASRVTSDGYRDRSSLDFKSFFLGAARFGNKSALRLHFYGGPIEDELVYFGISKAEALDPVQRTNNPLTRGDEIENFHQPHLELIHEYQLSKTASLSNTLFAIRGYGFFDFDGSWAPASYFRLTPEFGFDVQDPDNFYVDDLLIRAYVDNRQIGWLPNISWHRNNLRLVAGAEIRIHRSLHWGRIQKGSAALPRAVSGDHSGLNYIGSRRYYQYDGGKDIVSPYVHFEWHFFPKVRLSGDLQYVNQRYRLFDEAFLDNDFTVEYNFLNPRIGLSYLLKPKTDVYISIAGTSREPRLKNLYDAAEASTPAIWGAVEPQFERRSDGSFDFDEPLVQPEKLVDIEMGLGHRSQNIEGGINLFYMDFRDEIVKNGQLDLFGQPVTGNADRTLHSGVEVYGAARLSKKLLFNANVTISNNTLREYSIFQDGREINLDGNPIAGFPDLLANTRLSYRGKRFDMSLTAKFVGEQFTDNTANQSRRVSPYTVMNASSAYDIGSLIGRSGLRIQLHVQNLFNTLYITHGEGDSFFPAADRQIFTSLKLDL